MTRYTTSQTITAPAAGTYAIYCWGGGAGSRTSIASVSAGAGGGACSIKTLAVTAGQQLVLTIGAAGNGTSGAFGAGGDTSVQSPSGTTVCLAKGGAASSAGGSSASGIGDTKYSGGNGGASDFAQDPEGFGDYYGWGGGGGGAGSGSVGGSGQAGYADPFGDFYDGAGGSGGTGTYTGGSGGYKNISGASAPGGGAAGGVGSGSLGAVELIFTPSAAAPVITPSTTAFNVNENTAFAQDFNADQGVTWSLVGGTDQSKFTISGAGNLQMVAKNYEAPDDSNADRVYQVTFRATNTDGSGLFTNKTVTVTVLNDTSAPTITPATAAFNVANGVAFSQDYNSNQAGTTWSIVGGADAAQFSIDANGLISMAAKSYASPVDVGGNNVYDVTFRATGPEGVTTDKTIAVTVLPPPSHEFPTTSSQDAVGDRGWTNLTNLYSDNEVTSTFSIGPGNGEVSYTATLGGFNFAAIPDNATINGIELVSEINPTFGSGSISAYIDFNLFSGAGVAKPTRNFVRTDAEFIETLGGAADVWGLSGGNLTGSGFKSGFNVTMRVIAAASGTGRANPNIDYVKVKVYYTVPDDLVSTNIETTDAQITEATVGQRHVLAAQAIAFETPVIASATVGQRHALASTNIASGTPAIAAATIGQRHAISNINIATAAPAITTATIGQRHVLASVTVATAAPAISTAIMVLAKNLVTTNIVTSAPAIALATLNRIVAATSVNISTAAPAITTAAVGQRHVLASTNLSGVAPAISLSTVGQRHTLATVALAGNIPTIQAATVGQRHALITTNVATAAPAITAAVLGVIPAETRQAVPIETTIQGQWTTESGGSDLHNSIDELAPNDTDFIKSEPDVVNNITRIKLGGWQATSVHGIMKLRYRLQRVGPNPAFTQTVRLYEGSTLIAGPFVHNVDTIQAFEQDVDSALVSNPNNLFVEFEAA